MRETENKRLRERDVLSFFPPLARPRETPETVTIPQYRFNNIGQFLGSNVINHVLTTHLVQ